MNYSEMVTLIVILSCPSYSKLGSGGGVDLMLARYTVAIYSTG